MKENGNHSKLDLKVIGDNVGRLRRMVGITQEELAEKAGITATFIARIEGGTRGLSIDVLVKIAEALGVTPDMILLRDNPQEKKSAVLSLSGS